MRYIVGFLYHKATVLHVCYMIEQLPNTEPINNNVNLNNHQSEIMNRSNPDAADF